MIYWLTVASAAFTVWVYKKKGRLHRQEEAFRHSLARHGLAFLIPFTCVAVVYSVLSTYAFVIDDDGTAFRTLHAFDSFMQASLEVADVLKRPTSWAVGLFAATFLLSALAIFLGPPSIARGINARLARVSTSMASYSKAIGTVYAVLALFCSFTFFAHSLDAAHGDLKLRLKQAEEDIVAVGAGIEQGLAADALEKVLEQVLDEAPQEVVNALDEIAAALEARRSLAQRYETDAARLGIRSAPIERSLREHRPPELRQQEAARAGSADPANATSSRRLAAAEVPASTSADLQRARQDVERHNEASTAETAAEILNLGSRRRLTSALLGRLVRADGIGALEPLLEAYPIARPIVRAFERVVEDLLAGAFETRAIDPVIERLTRTVVTNPAEYERALDRAVRTLVAEHVDVRGEWRTELRTFDIALAATATRTAQEDRWRLLQLRADLDREIRGREQRFLARRQVLLEELSIEFRRIAESFPVRASTPAIPGLTRLPGIGAARSNRVLTLEPFQGLVEQWRRPARTESPASQWLTERQTMNGSPKEPTEHRRLYREEVTRFLDEAIETCKAAAVSERQLRSIETLRSLAAVETSGVRKFEGIESYAVASLSMDRAQRKLTPEAEARERAALRKSVQRVREARRNPVRRYRPTPRR